MSQVRDLLVSTADSLFESTVTKEVIDGAEAGDWPAGLWSSIVDNGLHDALVSEADGGVGLSLTDAVAVLRVAGRHAAPVPLAESLVGTRLLADAGLTRSEELVTMAPPESVTSGSLVATGDGWTLDAELHGVPWAGQAAIIVVPLGAPGQERVAAVPTAGCDVLAEVNLAGEPRDRVSITGLSLAADAVSEQLGPGRAGMAVLGVLSRLALMSGALEGILEITVDYARERIQFGRPIGQFQAMQQQLSIMAGQVAAAKAAADSAADEADHAAVMFAVAAAKARVGEAVGIATKIAHQVHGAIGFTHEHELHHRTRRLWAWRDEFGSEGFWAQRVGEQVLARGGDGLWPMLAGSPG